MNILQWLDAAGIPWRCSRAELTDRFGVTTHPAHQWPILPLEHTPCLVTGQIGPLAAQVRDGISSSVPATMLTTEVFISADADANIRATALEVSARLGSREPLRRWNTLYCEWESGGAQLKLTSWPDAWQSPMINPSHERDPRLRSACHLTIHTGWLPPLSAMESEQLTDFERLGRLASASENGPLRVDVAESNLEYARHAVAGFVAGGIGLVVGARLAWQDRHLYLVPLEHIVTLRVMRLTPAKGPGGSTLYVECRTPGASESKSLKITQAPGPDDLTELAQKIGGAVNAQVVLEPYYADC